MYLILTVLMVCLLFSACDGTNERNNNTTQRETDGQNGNQTTEPPEATPKASPANGDENPATDMIEATYTGLIDGNSIEAKLQDGTVIVFFMYGVGEKLLYSNT